MDASYGYSPYHQIVTLFIGFLAVLGPTTSKKPVKKRNDLVVSTVPFCSTKLVPYDMYSGIRLYGRVKYKTNSRL